MSDCKRCEGDGYEVCGRCPDRWEHAIGAVCDDARCVGGMVPCECQVENMSFMGIPDGFVIEDEDEDE